MRVVTFKTTRILICFGAILALIAWFFILGFEQWKLFLAIVSIAGIMSILIDVTCRAREEEDRAL